ncbi:hypothetical protein HNQ36_001055 [Afipia massiliensis]|uniref:Uncharacterized protein n=1 Tax=Afipia massiliensis TaxID=211460 RepID=A0A840MZR3_9BRAD|nr:hypothetical protein [Afipia massiliensis]MBB5051101.1 hypothetical protein [Afipia massiliensis]
MIKARMNNQILLGLSHANLDRLRADGVKGGIHIKGAELLLDFDIYITAAPNEGILLEAMSDMIGPDTKVNIDKRLKS